MRLRTSLYAAALVGALTAHSAPARAKTAVRWDTDAVELVVHPSIHALGQNTYETVVAAVSAWQEAPAAAPTMVVREAEGRELKDGPSLGYVEGRHNQNTVVFAAEGEPLARGALAITITTFHSERKTILDADIVFNGIHAFGDTEAVAAGPDTPYDFQNVLTHELGHFLGLGENPGDPEATMFPRSAKGETTQRTLNRSDEAALQDLYGPLQEPTAPDAAEDTAGPDADSDLVQYGCATRPGPLGGGWLSLVFAVGAMGAVVRRRHFSRAVVAGMVALPLAGAALGTSAVARADVSSPAEAHFSVHDHVHGAELDARVRHVTGTVVSSDSRWEGGLLVTEVVLDAEPSADDPSTTHTFRVYGGRAGHLVQVVAGAAVPAIGDRVAIPANGRDDDILIPLAVRRLPGPR